MTDRAPLSGARHAAAVRTALRRVVLAILISAFVFGVAIPMTIVGLVVAGVPPEAAIALPAVVGVAWAAREISSRREGE